MDCLSLDAVLAASFDWKELSNLLETHGIAIDHTFPEHILEMQVQNAVHHECHSDNSLSGTLEVLLNRLYEDLIIQSEGMNPGQMRMIVSNIDFRNPNRMGGLFWAVGSDPREEMGCVRRCLHQRSQVVLLRQIRFMHEEGN